MNEKDLAIERITSAYERTIKRLWVLCIIIFITCAVTNIGWIYYNSKYEVVESTQEVQQETESGDNNFIGGNGDINGETNN